MKMYDYLIVGSGLFGAVFAHEMKNRGKSCLIIEKRSHVGGNIYTEKIEGINVHKYGAHIFHTSDKEVWNYINKFSEFNNFINSPMARYKDEIYNLPFNMNTFSRIWNVKTPEEAKNKIESEKKDYHVEQPKNLEEQAINLVGKTIYEKLVKGYTEKQWNRDCKLLPAFIIKRIPVRFTYDNNYFSDRYQGIPIGGYTKIIEKLIDGVDLKLNTTYQDYIKTNNNFKKVIYTGPIDEYYNYKLGYLKYRTVTFETLVLDTDNYQGNAVINYTEREVPFTRIIEHKFFENTPSEKTIISKEFPSEWKFGEGAEPYYPINDDENNNLYNKYLQLANKETNVIFGGRLGEYKYYDMDRVIKNALNLVQKETKQ